MKVRKISSKDSGHEQPWLAWSISQMLLIRWSKWENVNTVYRKYGLVRKTPTHPHQLCFSVFQVACVLACVCVYMRVLTFHRSQPFPSGMCLNLSPFISDWGWIMLSTAAAPPTSLTGMTYGAPPLFLTCNSCLPGWIAERQNVGCAVTFLHFVAWSVKCGWCGLEDGGMDTAPCSRKGSGWDLLHLDLQWEF